MAVLIKIKAGTLIETIVASVLLVVIFGIATLILSNVFETTLVLDRSLVMYKLEQLEYRYLNEAITVPYTEAFASFEIHISEEGDRVVFEAVSIVDQRLLKSVSFIKNK